jgi:MFS transporter, UMF1 family
MGTRGQIFSWTLFDFANTGFHVIIITLVFPQYFSKYLGGNEADWGLTTGISMLLTALIGPLLGSIADVMGRKKRLLALFTIMCVIATAALYFAMPGMLLAAALLLIVANIGFEGGTIFYDAFLPELVPEKDYGRVSGYGFGMGYIGSFLALVLILTLLESGPAQAQSMRNTFLVAAAFFGLFSLPLFLFVPDRAARQPITGSALRVGYDRLRDTLGHLRRYESVKRFLIAYFVYNDSILTVVVFASIFASKILKLTLDDTVVFFLIVQGSALVGSIVFGHLTNRIGARTAILITLLIWIGVTVAGYFIETRDGFYMLGVAAGIALGASQSSSRTLMALLTPPERKTEFFGFYDGFFGKASAVIGPIVFGLVANAAGQRPAMLVLGAFFVLGIVLLLRVPDVRAGDAR